MNAETPATEARLLAMLENIRTAAANTRQTMDRRSNERTPVRRPGFQCAQGGT